MKKLGIVLAVCLTAAVLVPYTVSAESYIYTRSGEAVPSPAVYSVKKQVELAADGLAASSPQDVFRAESGELYFADTNNNPHPDFRPFAGIGPGHFRALLLRTGERKR